MDLVRSIVVICIAVSSLGVGVRGNVFDVIQFGAKGDGITDNSKAFTDAWNALCGALEAGSILQIPDGTFLLQPIIFKGPCKSSSLKVQITGKIVAPSSIQAWSNCNTYSWISFDDVDGLIVDGTGTIDGQGSAWWGNVPKGCQKPTALLFNNCKNLQLNGTNHVNSPRGHISVSGCNSVTISNIHITAPETSPNTDGIDIGYSTQVNIHDSVIGTGDDCVAINSGSSQINITSVNCGPGHGISVGSLGPNGRTDTVEQVHVQNCTFTKTQNAARIKTWPGGSGYARGITYQNITLEGSGNPIFIDQHYCGGSHDCLEKPGAVAVSDVTFIGVKGTSSVEQAITLDCSERGCKNIVMDQINIQFANPEKKTFAYCQNVQGKSGSTVPNVPCLRP